LGGKDKAGDVVCKRKIRLGNSGFQVTENILLTINIYAFIVLPVNFVK